MVIAMSKQKPSETKIINAQDGNAELLSTKDSPAIAEILRDVESELKSVGDAPSSLAKFLTSEFTQLGRSLLRCGYLVQQVDEQKLYEKFGFSNTASLLEASFGLKAPVVSRFRRAYEFALPISRAVPEVTIDDLNEAQMRELRGAVKALHSGLKGQQQVDKAVELYKELHEKTPCPTSSDIAKFCRSKVTSKNQDAKESKDENEAKAISESAEPSGDDEATSNEESSEVEPDCDPADGFTVTDEELGEPVGPIGEVKADDYIGTQLAYELSQLLGLVLDHSFIEDEIKERFERAFEQLGIEPTHPEEQEEDYE